LLPVVTTKELKSAEIFGFKSQFHIETTCGNHYLTPDSDNPTLKESMAIPHPVDIHVGKRLRLRRSILGMSQETLGKATGITFQQVQKYERGINRIGSSRLYDFSKILSVPVAFFFEEFNMGEAKQSARGFAEDEAAPFEHEPLSNKESIQLVRAFSRIKNPAVRKKILNLVKTLTEEE
jgi:transcriptional regulator with XRE-family HTH domain